MKVRLFRKDTIEDFAEDHSNGKKHFRNCLMAIENANWEVPKDITDTIRGNLLGNGSNRVVFDIGGNGSNAFRIYVNISSGVIINKAIAVKCIYM